MMETKKFTENINKLISTFGESHFRVERIKRIKEITDKFPPEAFDFVVNSIIDNFKYAPTPNDIREALYSWQKTNKKYVDVEIEAFIIRCSQCYDTGYLLLRANDNSHKVWCYCNCTLGIKKNEEERKLYFFDLDVLRLFNLEPFPKEKFKPEKPDMKTIEKKVKLFRQSVNKSKEFWQSGDHRNLLTDYFLC